MPRTAGHAPVAAIALVAAGLTLGAAVVPAHAEAVVYETKNVEATHPEGGVEWASLDIPTGYEKQRLNRHSVAFVEQNGAGRTISIHLDPKVDTLGELKKERAALKKRYADSYREFAFRVKDRDSKVRATWVYTFEAEGTDETEPWISVSLVRHNQVRVVGKVSERQHVRRIRDHVVRSVQVPS
ncbi:hypothetical protein [Nocardioides caldifontis]|uniref:hypothetical protein n=1 Tax=Nocardioides caldifontis TaxID=2588938 RepID=UPI0011E04D10|nr:hypothetical protein [Nocardioides caldifontis]